MKKTISLFLFIFIHVGSIFCQELLTHIKDGGSSDRFILREIDGQKYALEVDFTDQVTVYNLTSGMPEKLHSRFFTGISQFPFFFQTVNNYLLLYSPKASIAYDFVNDKVKEFPYTGNFANTRWGSNYGSLVLLNQTTLNLNQVLNININLDNGHMDTLDQYAYYRNQSKDYIWKYKVLANNIEDHYIVNKNTGEEVLFTTQIIYATQYIFNDKNIIYLKGNKVVSYNFIDKTESTIDSFATSSNKVNLFDMDDHFIISTDNYAIDNTYNQKLYDDQFHLISTFTSKSKMNSVHPQIIDDKIIYTDNILRIYDISDAITTDILSTVRFAREAAVLEGRYLVYMGVYGIGMFDLFTNTPYKLNNFDDYGKQIKKLEVLKLNDTYLLNFERNLESYFKLYEIDVPSKSAIKYEYLQTSQGLQKDSKVLKVDDDVLLLSKDLYHVIGNQLIKLNAKPLDMDSYNFYKLDRAGLYWKESTNTTYEFYLFKNGVKSLFATIPKYIMDPPIMQIHISEYKINGDYLYLSIGGFQNLLYSYHREEKILKPLISADVNLISSFHHKGFFYFPNGINHLLMVDSTGAIKIEKINNFQSIIVSYFLVGEKLYIIQNDGLYQLEGFELIKIAAANFELYRNLIQLSENLFLIETYNATHFFDGTNFWSYEKPADTQFVKSYKNTIIYSVAGNNGHTFKAYNYITNQLTDLPQDFANKNLISIIENKGKAYILSTNYTLANYFVEVHAINNAFDSTGLVQSFDASGKGFDSAYRSFNDEGLLYIGNRIFLVDDSLHFIPLNVSGDPNAANIVEQDGYFYFLALDQEHGRQLYRVLALSKRVATTDVHKNDIAVFPIPSSNYLTIQNKDRLHIEKIRLLYSNGTLHSTIDANTETIDISNLLNGMYYLEIQTEKKREVVKFLKIN